MSNVDQTVVESFGKEWRRFDYSLGMCSDMEPVFRSYFAIFPWDQLPTKAVGFDLGCGTGRWASFVAPRVGLLYCIDPSIDALEVARHNLRTASNCSFNCASVDEIPLPDRSADFGYSLGVLHHVPDTQEGIRACALKLKPGAPLLIYLYYAFDNRPRWFCMIWKGADYARRVISLLPFTLRARICDFIAIFVYWPFARIAKQLEKFNVDVGDFPLSAYRDRSFYFMRTDSLDRFGARIEKRFTRKQIGDMMENAGFERIVFSESPCWCAVGYRRVDLP